MRDVGIESVLRLSVNCKWCFFVESKGHNATSKHLVLWFLRGSCNLLRLWRLFRRQWTIPFFAILCSYFENGKLPLWNFLLRLMGFILLKFKFWRHGGVEYLSSDLERRFFISIMIKEVGDRGLGVCSDLFHRFRLNINEYAVYQISKKELNLVLSLLESRVRLCRFNYLITWPLSCSNFNFTAWISPISSNFFLSFR